MRHKNLHVSLLTYKLLTVLGSLAPQRQSTEDQ